jgi:hypothetical protein
MSESWFERIGGHDRCPRFLHGGSMGPSVAAGVVLFIMCMYAGDPSVCLWWSASQSMIATATQRILAFDRSLVQHLMLLALGALDVATRGSHPPPEDTLTIAFVVYFRRYQNCDAGTGWLVYVVVSSAVLSVAMQDHPFRQFSPREN